MTPFPFSFVGPFPAPHAKTHFNGDTGIPCFQRTSSLSRPCRSNQPSFFSINGFGNRQNHRCVYLLISLSPFAPPHPPPHTHLHTDFVGAIAACRPCTPACQGFAEVSFNQGREAYCSGSPQACTASYSIPAGSFDCDPYDVIAWNASNSVVLPILQKSASIKVVKPTAPTAPKPAQPATASLRVVSIVIHMM
jgi:hypothetical protein